jgi:hypothetical protein
MGVGFATRSPQTTGDQSIGLRIFASPSGLPHVGPGAHRALIDA